MICDFVFMKNGFDFEASQNLALREPWSLSGEAFAQSLTHG
jgi:hypothetical protein